MYFTIGQNQKNEIIVKILVLANLSYFHRFLQCWSKISRPVKDDIVYCLSINIHNTFQILNSNYFWFKIYNITQDFKDFHSKGSSAMFDLKFREF